MNFTFLFDSSLKYLSKLHSTAKLETSIASETAVASGAKRTACGAWAGRRHQQCDMKSDCNFMPMIHSAFCAPVLACGSNLEKNVLSARDNSIFRGNYLNIAALTFLPLLPRVSSAFWPSCNAFNALDTNHFLMYSLPQKCGCTNIIDFFSALSWEVFVLVNCSSGLL